MQTPKKPHAVSARLLSRRDALRHTTALAVAVAAGTTTLFTRQALAADLPRLDEDNPQARALGYRHDAATVDGAKFPGVDPAAKNCANCQLFQVPASGDWGGCPLFAGKAVNAKGWCTAWVQRAGQGAS